VISLNIVYRKVFFLNLGNYHFGKQKDWEYYLNRPKTGISFCFSDLGNKEALGYAYRIVPYVEFSLFTSRIDRFNLLVSMGGYFLYKKYNIISNP